MKQVYTSLRRRIAVNPFTHIVILLMQSISAYTDISQAKFGLFLAIILYGLFVAFLLWIVSLFCSEFLFGYIKSESGAVKIGIKWLVPLALAAMVMFLAPFGKVGARFAPPGKLCELSADCTGWVNVGTVGVNELPADLTFAKHLELLPYPNASAFGEFCPVSFKWPARPWLKVEDNEETATVQTWTQTDITSDRGTDGSPSADKHSQSCTIDDQTETCLFLVESVKLLERQRVKVVGCALVNEGRQGYQGYLDMWLEIQDPTYRSRPITQKLEP